MRQLLQQEQPIPPRASSWLAGIREVLTAQQASHTCAINVSRKARTCLSYARMPLRPDTVRMGLDATHIINDVMSPVLGTSIACCMGG